MRLIRFSLAAAAVLSLIAAPVMAQQAVGGRVTTAAPTYVTGETRPLSIDTSGNLRVITTAASATGASATQQQGNAVDNTANLGNPVWIGCRFNASPAVQDEGDRAGCQSNNRGSIRVTPSDGINDAAILANSADDKNAATVGMVVNAYTYAYDGATIDRLRTINGALTAGTGTQAVAVAPTTAAAAGLAPTVTSVAASSIVLCAAACNSYDWRVTAGALPGYVMVFNATSAPADGTVTPADCVSIAANATVGSSTQTVPERMSVGAVIVFSTTGCFSKTASATAFIRGRGL